jgi:tetratricopeptide (TPR) repeat protein
MTRSTHGLWAVASFAILLFLTACQSQSFRVDSEPAGADVFISSQGQTPRKLGVTPYAIQASDQGDKTQAIQVIVSKDGSGSESVLLPPAAMGRAGGMFVRLESMKVPISCQNQEVALEKVARGVAESQYQIKIKNLDQAERTLNALAAEYANVSVLHDLLGNVHFLRKDIDRALSSYRRSQAIAPNNSETTRMIKRLEELKGGAR